MLASAPACFNNNSELLLFLLGDIIITKGSKVPVPNWYQGQSAFDVKAFCSKIISGCLSVFRIAEYRHLIICKPSTFSFDLILLCHSLSPADYSEIWRCRDNYKVSVTITVALV